MDFLLLLNLYRDEADGKISTEKKDQERGKRRDREIGNNRTEKEAMRELLIMYCKFKSGQYQVLNSLRINITVPQN